MDIKKHKINLTNILIDIYKDNLLSSNLGFKGGTGAMLFYNLPRFSVDLDFDIIKDTEIIGDQNKLKEITNRITKLLSKKYILKDQSTKYNTLFWLVSYGEGEHNIKIEVSTRNNPYNHYCNKLFYGVTVKLLDIKDMIAHKMVAFTERPSVANRDLFDMHFLLGSEHASDINYEIIKLRTGKDPKDFYKLLLNLIENINPNNILEGLGEVLTDSQKDWVKAKLLVELKGLIQRQIDLT
ncbi:MAG: nucleotidyl transferase AbiEii/AbiGii toxin family protein [Candidatus Woesebacteria bacterium]|nr:nucleotidyl transferase AbiEii/AbiGii toxin family protein [Candidatus Woesebacteria bacterium]